MAFKLFSLAALLLCVPQFCYCANFNVTVANFAFTPAALQIAAGDTVTWTLASGSHTVTEGTACTHTTGFNTAVATVGATFSQTFLTNGTIYYFCIPHCSAFNMVANITVGNGIAPTPAPTAKPSGAAKVAQSTVAASIMVAIGMVMALMQKA